MSESNSRRCVSYLESLVIRRRLHGIVPPPTIDPEVWSDFLTCAVRGALDRERERLHRAAAMKDAALEISESRDWSAEAKFAAGRSSSSYIGRVVA